ncbi:hypothetical protein BV25DRAFT_1989981 [Artomyces pyxidatus]|uniref:Uncharacterized protein n=1 Tax=Artomyces pyxidatus TaxID=48021 RepID=A0ACB8T8I2_9AGAM|nr:hypothetical protein BV25DRAFT_1989981 [Artomyces pyxidatus]
MSSDYVDYEYFRIGGLNSHSHSWYQWNQDALVKALMGNRQDLDLVLGIVPSGASYLLLPLSDWPRLRDSQNLHGRQNRPFSANEYLSLSPIHFDNPAQLSEKLTKLKPKKQKQGMPLDNSQANKQFISDGGDTRAGETRSCFEHCRVLYGALHQQLRVGRFGIVRPPRWDRTHFVAFTFNTWRYPQAEEVDILDIGWSTLSLGHGTPEYQSSVHINLFERSKFGRPKSQKAEFAHGTAETLRQDAMSARLQAFLGQLTGPVVLLVYDMNITRDVLKELSIDTTNWAIGIRELLYPQNQLYPRRDGYDNHSRRRSRSPHRGGTSYDPRRQRSPPRPASSSRVHLVDVRSMYTALKQTSPVKERMLIKDALDLDLQWTVDTWCAGNESRLLGDMWCAMASGQSIDEQHKARWGPGRERAGVASLSTATPAEIDPNDPDFDPNDYVAPPIPSASGKSSSAAAIYDDWDHPDSDDDDDEGAGRYYH